MGAAASVTDYARTVLAMVRALFVRPPQHVDLEPNGEDGLE